MYFNNVLYAETGETTTPVDDILDSFEELKTADNATQAQMVMYSKLFKFNFYKNGTIRVQDLY